MRNSSKSFYNIQNCIFRIPGYLTGVYNSIFKPLRISRLDFLSLFQDSKAVGVGPGEFLFHEGDVMNQDLRYLI